MAQRMRQVLFVLCVLGSFCAIASADEIGVGVLSYDAISSTQDQFDITNLTGSAALPPTAPITSELTFTVASLVVDLTSGSITLPGSDFTVVDSDGDLDCTSAACNLFGDSITSVTLTGTLSPTTGLSGLPSGDTGIEAAFTTTLTPGCGGATLSAGCDAAIIDATGTSGVTPAPEPGTLVLGGIGIIGLLFVARRRRDAGGGCNSAAAA